MRESNSPEVMTVAFGSAAPVLASDSEKPLSVVGTRMWSEIVSEARQQSAPRVLAFWNALRVVLQNEPASQFVTANFVEALRSGRDYQRRLDAACKKFEPFRIAQLLRTSRQELAIFFDHAESTLLPNGEVSEDALGEARRVWEQISQDMPDLPAPQAGVAADGSFVLVWRNKSFHLEIEFFTDGHWESFFRDKIGEADEPFFDEDIDDSQVSDKIRQTLNLFVLTPSAP